METQNKFRVEIRTSDDCDCSLSYDTCTTGGIFNTFKEAKDECLSFKSEWKTIIHKHAIKISGNIVEIDANGDPIGDDIVIWQKIDKPIPDTCPTRYTGKWING